MINYLLSLPVGLVIIILNVPILLISYRFLSRKYVFTTLVGMLCSSLFIDFFNQILKWPKGTENMLLAAIYGGLLLGLGLGLVFRGEASTGGSDVIGLILNKYLGVSVGMGIMVTDFIIISASGLVFRQLEAPLYGYIVLFISSRVIDLVLEGWNFSKMVIITSSEPEKIADYILHRLERSGGALKSRSLYLNREGEIIITVIHRKQLSELKAFIKGLTQEPLLLSMTLMKSLARVLKPTTPSNNRPGCCSAQFYTAGYPLKFSLPGLLT